jgi:transcriptional regulator GlxA family with amidase domain
MCPGLVGARLGHTQGCSGEVSPNGKKDLQGRASPTLAQNADTLQGVTTSAGLGIATSPLPRTRTPPDTLMVPGGPGVDAAAADAVLVDWVRQRKKKARRVASVCTGAFLLGASGALDGRRAVTHWSWCAELARRFPAARVESAPIFVRDGSVWTSAGVTAGIDLALALVEEDLGRTVALAVARYLVVFLKRPGGQAQFSEALFMQSAEDEFGALLEWINKHLFDDLTLAMLADQAGMSERSFSRHYAEATGVTPARAIEQLRVEAARRLLSESRLPVKRICSVAASARKKPCVAASSACFRQRRTTTAPGSALKCRLLADIVAKVFLTCRTKILRVRPETSGRIAEFSEHEAD